MPEPEHVGSSCTAVTSQKGDSLGCTCRKSVCSTRTASPAACAERLRSTPARRTSRSHAMTRPPGAARAAICQGHAYGVYAVCMQCVCGVYVQCISAVNMRGLRAGGGGAEGVMRGARG
eukprot:scaffold53235_cov68-Phaeocystis_antarctica.AAC.1